MIDRVADTITDWGRRDGYFVDDEEADAFNAELKYVLVHQRAAFNSPVWFNIGVKNTPQQASACFILAVEDTMSGILNWYREEGTIFKGGSGSGINLSNIRSSSEGLKGGGTASGPVSFMRGADASAGTIKSGGKTRRAAKMVILNADHPDVEEFIWCKATEERKARALRDAGFDMDLDGKDSHSIQYQNANNSVRVTDEFMQAVVDDEDWALKAVLTGETIKTVKARDLMRQISDATWQCADPGMQFDTTINRWHTAPNTGRINASNPCSEYMHLDNSACNLASINLLEYIDEGGAFDVSAYQHTVEVMFTAQEILVGNADYPTEAIGETSRQFRQLGLGYANLGALLMSQGLPYDSPAGRAWAASLTALMTGHAYATSARTAGRMGPFAGYAENEDAMLNVLRMHRAEAAKIDEELVPPELLSAAQRSWDDAVELGERYGVRNSQATVLAPTGTIGLMMDCDTTGIEPDLALTKAKKLVGGGTMFIVNQAIPRSLRNLGYSDEQVTTIVDHIDEHKTIIGAPEFNPEHLPVFACSMGDNPIHYMGHVTMMGAVQPFLSGAISKTVNMPEEVTVEEVEQLHIESWRLGLKSVAVYRDNCKVGQPLSTQKSDAQITADGLAGERDRRADRRARDRAGAGPPQDVAGPGVQDVLVPGRRLPRLRDGRRVRGRPSGRGVPPGRQAGLDPRRDHGCVRDLGEPRPAVRRADRGVLRDVHQHALRAGGHDRRPGHPVRHEPRRLHLPPSGGRVHARGQAPRHGHPHRGGASPADAARRRGGRGCGRAGHGAAPARGPRPVGRARGRRGGPAGHADPEGRRAVGAGPRARDGPLLRLRRHHAARRLLPRLPDLRRDERLLVV